MINQYFQNKRLWLNLMGKEGKNYSKTQQIQKEKDGSLRAGIFVNSLILALKSEGANPY
jgi:hypothetical protein